jgi:hypothetical protein
MEIVISQCLFIVINLYPYSNVAKENY